MPARGTRLVLISGSRMGESINPKATPPAATPEGQHQAVSSGVCTEDAPPGPGRCTPLPPVSTGTFNLFLGLVQAPTCSPRHAPDQPPHARTHTDTQHTAEHSMQESGWFLAEDGWCASALGKALTPWVREPAPPLRGPTAPRGGPTPSPGPTRSGSRGDQPPGRRPRGLCSWPRLPVRPLSRLTPSFRRTSTPDCSHYASNLLSQGALWPLVFSKLRDM